MMIQSWWLKAPSKIKKQLWPALIFIHGRLNGHGRWSGILTASEIAVRDHIPFLFRLLLQEEPECKEYSL